MSGARFSIGPLTLVAEVAAIAAWLKSAAPGERMTYATGRVVPRDAAGFVHARHLSDAGQVVLSSARDQGGVTQWIMVRAGRGCGDRAPVTVSPRDQALALIAEAAARGDVAPTNRELASLLGYRRTHQGAYLVRDLVQRGLITVADFGPLERRVITIVATGAKTARGAL